VPVPPVTSTIGRIMTVGVGLGAGTGFAWRR